MRTVEYALIRLYVAAVLRTRDERGDVPGWVMITVMSATVVAALTGIARPELSSMLENALATVSGR
ncbi:hypothetical protein [Nocardioides speluncae]|uniref:hypothetical protein n=1 Tax=Nocardioides speluncae TaxID=2670337 RepID=UPI000D69275F|nr:hypothetical protein [Nocardioides speluncae]